MRATIIIITHNSAGVLGRCLDSLRETPSELVVVDNASADQSAGIARAAGAIVIANPENRGFAAAANQGARAAQSEYLLYLNPDTELLQKFDDLILALDRDPGASASAGLLVDLNGRPQTGFTLRRLPTFAALAFEVLLINRLWPSNPVNRRYRCLDRPLDDPGEAEQPPAACLMLRRSALDAVGGWDERFFPIWFEDVDLCARLRAAGYRILFCPSSRWRHQGGHSLDSISFAQRQLFWYRNLLGYVQKHMGSAAAPAMRILVFAGATARMFAMLFRPSGEWVSAKTWGAYWAVLRLALLGP